MRTIWKYPLELRQFQAIIVPYAADLLSVQVQRNVVCLWAMVDSDQPKKETRAIWIFGTGHEIQMPTVTQFLGTVQMESGGLIWHVFAELRNPR